MRNNIQLALLRSVGVLLIAIGVALLCFLGVWFWEVVLWLIFAPLAIGSLYAGWKMCRPSKATARAVIYWAISVLWVLAFVMILFKDVTLIGGITAAILAASVVGAVYVLVQRSMVSNPGVLS
jgi:hypothetical protein